MDINETLKKLTLEEKISLLSGKNVWETRDIPRLNIPSLYLSDGPHGLRKQIDENNNMGISQNEPATCFPPACTTASSFDRQLLTRMGKAIASECIEHDVSILLGPGVNIKRSPLCGRNFEYFSEDPLLAGEMGKAFVTGVQSLGVGTSVKHYMGNNQETYRQTIDTIIDERALNEIYLAAFKNIIQAQPYTVMSSYNKVNGEYVGESKLLLEEKLRKEFGFTGIVVSDWGACNDRVQSLKNGQDLDMPSSRGLYTEILTDAVKSRKLTETDIDLAVTRILNAIDRCTAAKSKGDSSKNHELAREIASKSMVLLKNEGNLLPIGKAKIAVIGEMAKKPRYQGTGSSKITPKQLENVADVLKSRNMQFIYARGYNLETDETDEILIEEAVNAAKRSEIPIVFIGLTERYESEGFDRSHMHLPDSHNRLVQEVVSANPNTVVVLTGGSPVEMPWIKNVKALLNSYLGGEAGAGAIADILYGIVNPSGKLAETYPIKLNDNPSSFFFPGGNNSVHYQESIFVGYRYYDTQQRDVLFPFGYGLSYTQFKYDHLQITSHEKITVSFDLENTGSCFGEEIVQLYVKKKNSQVFRAEKELKEFAKIPLKPNELEIVRFILDKNQLAYYDSGIHEWVLEDGEYEFQIGASSRDIRLKKTVYVKGQAVHSTLPKEYHFTLDEFKNLCGKELPPLFVIKKKPFTMNSTLHDIRKTLIGRILIFMGIRQVKKNVKNDPTTVKMMISMLMDSPLRSVINFSGRDFTVNEANALLLLINGHFLKVTVTFFKKNIVYVLSKIHI